jgi:hypothetical protein
LPGTRSIEPVMGSSTPAVRVGDDDPVRIDRRHRSIGGPDIAVGQH